MHRVKHLILILMLLVIPLQGMADGFFTMPHIPDSLSKPEKAAWIVTNYWEGADFSKETPAEVEQAFVDYLTILQIAPQCSFLNVPRRESIISLADKYLKEKDSPLYSPERYELYVKSFLGNEFPDFPLRLSDGTTKMLSEAFAVLKKGEEAKGDSLGADVEDIGVRESDSMVGLLLFDPGCDECLELIAELAKAGVTNVVAVNMNEEATAPKLPEQWLLCTAADDSVYKLYPFRRLPFYISM